MHSLSPCPSICTASNIKKITQQKHRYPLHFTTRRNGAVCCALSTALRQTHKDFRYGRRFKQKEATQRQTSSYPSLHSSFKLYLAKNPYFLCLSHTHTHTISTLCATKLFCTSLKFKHLPNSAELATNQRGENTKFVKAKSSDSFQVPKSCRVSVRQSDCQSGEMLERPICSALIEFKFSKCQEFRKKTTSIQWPNKKCLRVCAGSAEASLCHLQPLSLWSNSHKPNLDSL